jgi:hypothetical protein
MTRQDELLDIGPGFDLSLFWLETGTVPVLPCVVNEKGLKRQKCFLLIENAAFRSDAMEGKEEDDTEEEDMDTESCDSNAASKDSNANERYIVLALTTDRLG